MPQPPPTHAAGKEKPRHAALPTERRPAQHDSEHARVAIDSSCNSKQNVKKCTGFNTLNRQKNLCGENLFPLRRKSARSAERQPAPPQRKFRRSAHSFSGSLRTRPRRLAREGKTPRSGGMLRLRAFAFINTRPDSGFPERQRDLFLGGSLSSRCPRAASAPRAS